MHQKQVGLRFVPDVTCGMWVQPGTKNVNSFKNYCGVVNNITFCILLQIILYFDYSVKIVNLETAFLYGELEEGIYMECPQGMSNVKKDECIN